VPDRSVVHHAAEAFDRAGEEYERGRPTYPADAFATLVDELRIGPGRRVLDLAAGTGKLTQLLAKTGAEVVAVEPADGMRRRIEEQLPGVEALTGTAEAIPLGDGSVEAVAVAQAFHWFDGEAALAEIHRVLAPGGRLGLIWNARDDDDPFQARLTAIMEAHRGDAPRYVGGVWRKIFERTDLFTPLQHARFGFVQDLEPERVVDRVVSVSFIAALPDEERARVAGQVRALVASDPATRESERVPLPYRTDVFWCERV
jgi:ubiquinone/menaquinone biosynthesis C-methylase UbiE